MEFFAGIIIGGAGVLISLFTIGARNLRKSAPAKAKAAQDAANRIHALRVARSALVAVMHRGQIDTGGAKLAYRAEATVSSLLGEPEPSIPEGLSAPKGGPIQ